MGWIYRHTWSSGARQDQRGELGNVGTAPCQGQLEGKKLCRSLRGQARGDEEKVKASQRLMKKKKNQVWNNI